MRTAMRAGGFSLLEALVALAILGSILAVGAPRMAAWVDASRAAAATQFYAEGFALARAQALSHNSASRLVLSENANGQMNWQVDICFPSPTTPCNDASGSWSTTAAAANRDPEGAAGFKSVLRSAESLPGTGVLVQTIGPDDADSVYFTPVGWVDTTVTPRIARMDMEPAEDHVGDFPAAAVVLTLAGIATKCQPDADDGDPHRCPP
ncbi:type II secretion system protein [Massilia sp. YIM B02769]|nr:type II secretion system protein [Massilia sp. YIM B02769]